MKIFSPLLLLFLFIGSSVARAQQTIATFTQGMKKQEGFFNYYYDEKSGRLFLEIDKLDKEFLYFSSLASGVGAGIERGQASSSLVKFIKTGPKIFLTEPNTSYRAVTLNKDEIAAVENAFAQSVIMGFVPVASDGNKFLIDLTPFLIRDSQKIGPELTDASGPGAGAFKVDETRSAIFMPRTRNFPKNTEFEAMVTFAGGPASPGRSTLAPDPNAVTVHLHQAFIELPDDNFKMRKFDPRSGMNLFSYSDFAAPMDQPLIKRFSRRHRLQKKYPDSAMSEPVKPIVYYIDRGAPEILQKALIEGGSWWNEAFEAAGFRNAFQVKVLPEDADPMDIRYNIVNWINRSGNPRDYSYGYSYIDPRTGEILKGVVTLGSDRHRQDYLIAEGLLQPYEDGKPISDKMKELSLARLRQLAAHEIGHTLGFYHNFAASTKDRASVMDYPFPKISLKPDGTIDVSDAYAKGIGAWDIRTVIWGYSEFPVGSDEDAELEKIMQETLKQGFVFIPDVGGYVHPASHQWDNGDDPVAYLYDLMKVRRKVLDDFSEKAIKKGSPMAQLEEVLVPMYLLHRYQIEAVAKSIGGLYFTHAVRNDGQVITKMISPAVQWKAFDALMSTISPDALALPEKLIGMIPPRPSGYPLTTEAFKRHTGVAFDPLAAAETAAATTISFILDPEKAARLIEYEARDSRQPGFLAIAEKLMAATWKAKPLAGYKGELETVVNNLTLKYLLQLAADTKASETVRGQALFVIGDLKKWMTTQLAAAAPKQKSALLFGLSQINAFSQHPDRFQPAPAFEMPPGAPIGMPCF